jgi:hypothetical protein
MTPWSAQAEHCHRISFVSGAMMAMIKPVQGLRPGRLRHLSPERMGMFGGWQQTEETIEPK